jgi:hypothetical protein
MATVYSPLVEKLSLRVRRRISCLREKFLQDQFYVTPATILRAFVQTTYFLEHIEITSMMQEVEVAT